MTVHTARLFLMHHRQDYKNAHQSRLPSRLYQSIRKALFNRQAPEQAA
ncbi:hypothetical protein [Labrenzia sp. 011]|nr:hypothetical protein [Labrenzia sp. 011]